VDAVVQCLGKLGPPSVECLTVVPSRIATALDVFVGYVMLDAWIANQDRHHENWGCIWNRGDIMPLRLAPTFDHGASLARNVRDEEKIERLGSGDRGRQVAHFATKARSAFYRSNADSRPLGTVDAFIQFAEASPKAAEVWLEAIKGVTRDEIYSILREVPPNRMSETTRRFTLELLMANQARLLKLL